ncbi:hypothetical protein CMUS01_05844 [Colletotrichum musicola]|uniref:Uncharacterized protein n=1 Tax=Colletotrichum musicola TaxID=2175873 RepID=A0A8H6NIV3_9PEZI|nr:hypothetical protein CMUS01_05844 [Colletotrichum musicola]
MTELHNACPCASWDGSPGGRSTTVTISSTRTLTFIHSNLLVQPRPSVRQPGQANLDSVKPTAMTSPRPERFGRTNAAVPSFTHSEFSAPCPWVPGAWETDASREKRPCGPSTSYLSDLGSGF